MCTKTMIKIALGSVIAYCAVGIVKHTVCMIAHLVQGNPHDLDSVLDDG